MMSAGGKIEESMGLVAPDFDASVSTYKYQNHHVEGKRTKCQSMCIYKSPLSSIFYERGNTKKSP